MYSWLWILIPLAMFAIPLAGILLGFWTSWLSYRFRRAALESLKAYAAQGTEPPAALLEAVGPPPQASKDYWSNPDNWGQAKTRAKKAAADVEDAVDTAFKETPIEKHERRRRRKIDGAWSGMIWSGAIAGGFWVASYYVTKPSDQHTCIIVAIILASICAASFVSAIVTTMVWRK